MKQTKKFLTMLLVLVMVAALPVLSSAKTSSDTIEAPAGSTAVFSVQAGSSSVDFTWDEISGQGSYPLFTSTYAAKVNGVETTQDWTGVKLADLLAAAEQQMGVSFSSDCQISAIAADGFTSVFTVADVKDDANLFMVAGDPCSNYDGEQTYDNSYVRILRAVDAANQANIRCVTGIRILDADGNEWNSDSSKSKTQGGDVENAVFYIAVKESADSSYKYYYYTEADLNAYDDRYDFKYVDHTVPKTVTGRGASLANLIADISDAEITGDMIVQYAESDGYHADAATPIEDSAYKDKVSWLTDTHVNSGGDTTAAVNTMICLTSWTTYDNPDENNVNSTEWEDADMDSGYLRAYRQRDDANSAVIKTLMGVVISPSGDVFTGKDGYTLTARSAGGQSMRIIEPSTGIAYSSQKVTGLVPGMQYAVKAPEITGAEVSGPDTQIITAAEGTDTTVEFTYQESNWLTVNGESYTLSAFEALPAFTQTPSADQVSEHGTPYGYYNAMYYRYTGVWLNDLVSGDAVLKAADGSELSVPAADTGKYFIVSGYTASKSSTNVSEGKRYTYALAQPQVIVPEDGTLVGEAEAGAEGNKMVTVAVEKLQSVNPAGNADDTWVNPFTDVQDSDYYFEPVKWAVENAITTGTSETTFSPDADCTRAQMVTFLWRSKGCPETAAADNPFTDVKEDSYYYKAVLWAAEQGITTGTSQTTFSPDAIVSRAQSVTFLWRMEGSSEVTVDNPFTDVDAGAYYAKAVDWAVKNKITTGKTETSFAPEDACVRAQIVTFLYRGNQA